MGSQAVFTGKAWEQRAPHAPGNIVVGPVLYTSGITARAPEGALVAPGDMAGQVRQVVANVKDVLRAGGSGPDRIVKLTVYVTSIDEYLKSADACSELYVNRPSSTLVEVRRLQMPEMVVEIEAVAQAAAQ